MMLTLNTTSSLSARLLRCVLLAFLSLVAPALSWAQVSDAQRDYVLGAGDVIRVSVYQNADLTLETRVAESGTISFPLLGQIRLGGLSIPKAEKVIADGLRNGNFVRQPQVSILVTQIRGNQASVLGMVNRPGRYPIELTGMRLSELLATAGGIAAGGSDLVTLSGVRDSRAFRVVIDLPNLFSASTKANDPVIVNGDTVYVDRMPMVYIYGEVQRPGAMRLERDMTVIQALATGGGLTQRGTEKGLRVHRRNAEGKVEILQPGMNDAMKDGDVIYVRESLF
ncbi:polysaccharide export protein EpsE [Sphaerotilus sp.]|jgi:polysaccharide biosynthesis/export protein|uniref:polysaccharide export protein EpsE n=1 Tax=Sphaerotilus sp. TaxID=2093942 RepID=UPI0025F8826D|nr:polysaccharide export protein EpsE [Sphaerotilus sp.]